MSDKTTPTHYRLLSTLKAIGPYVREGQCSEGFYLFDCLSVCVDDQKSPEEREFWGWWMELEPEGEHLAAKYHLGLYNLAGDWIDTELPASAIEDVYKTQEIFHLKLTQTLVEKFGIVITLHQDSIEFV